MRHIIAKEMNKFGLKNKAMQQFIDILNAQCLQHHHRQLKACSQCCLDLNVLQNIFFLSHRTTKVMKVWLLLLGELFL